MEATITIVTCSSERVERERARWRARLAEAMKREQDLARRAAESEANPHGERAPVGAREVHEALELEDLAEALLGEWSA